MAKINVDTRSGALWELLKKKGMTQVDAHQKTGVDRKTLSKINRGGPVKLEKLQRVANKLEVPVEFLQPPAAEVTVDGDVPEPNTILLCKLDVARLFELLSGTERLEWKLNAHVKDEEARRFLEDFETAVENFRKQHALISHSETDNLSLRAQLDRLKTQDDVAAHLERLAVLRLALFGADYLFWDCDSEHGKYKSFVNYYSSRIVLLSVEPGGTQSRRTPVFQGKLPPRFDHLNAPDITIYVNGEELPKLDDSNIPSLRTLDDRAAPGASQGESDFAPPEVRKDERLRFNSHCSPRIFGGLRDRLEVTSGLGTLRKHLSSRSFSKQGSKPMMPAAMRLTTLASTLERGGIAASRSKGANEHITANGTFVLSGETPGPEPVLTPTQPQTSTFPRASRCPLSGSRFFLACMFRSG